MPNMNYWLQVYQELKHAEDHEIGSSPNLGQLGSQADLSDGGLKTVIEFTATQSAVMEGDGRIRIAIRRYGKQNNRILFK